MEDKKPFIENPKKGLIIFAIASVANIFFGLLFMIFPIIYFDLLEIEIPSNHLNAIASILASIGVFLIFLAAFGKTILDKIKSIFTFKAVLYGFIGFFIFYFGSFIYNIFIYYLGIETRDNTNQEFVSNMVKNIPILSFILVVILAPIVEEITYRYALFGSILKYNRILAYIISGLVFTLVHFIASIGSEEIFIELISFFPYAFSGLVFAYIYEKSKNLGSAIFAHSLNNLISYLFIVLGVFL